MSKFAGKSLKELKMNIKKWFYIPAVLAFFACGNTNTETKEDTTVNAHGFKYQENDKSLLWEISGNGLKQPSYLFGTIHVIGESDFIWSDVLDKALDTSNVLITEVAIKDLMSIDPSFLKIAGDSTIKDFTTDEQYKQLVDFTVEKMKITPELFDQAFANTKPIMLQQQLSLMSLEKQTKSYEMVLAMKASEQGIENDGLETKEFQLGVFSGIPMEEQIDWLMETVTNFDSAKMELDKLIESYTAQDLNGLSEQMAESSPEMMKYEDEFLTKRNLDWIPKIKEFTKDKVCFIAVGAGHLPGENGVIELLKKEGYTLKPISIK